MDNTLSTLPAVTQTNEQISIPVLLDRIKAAEQSKRLIEDKIKLLRERLLLASDEDKKQYAAERAADPTSLDDLLGDPSYSTDADFVPSVLDENRKSTFQSGDMESQVRQRMRNIAQLQQNIATLERLPKDIVHIRRSLELFDGSTWRKIKNLVWDGGDTQFRESLVASLRSLEEQMPNRLQNIATTQAALAFEKAKSEELLRSLSYDADVLHKEPTAEALLPRTEQAVLMQLKTSRNDNIMSLHIPRSPDDTNFSHVVTFEFSATDLQDFGELAGKEIPADGIFDTLGENTDGEFDFENTLVPFPLEVVDINDEKQFRLPQVVWERFGKNVVKD